MKVSENWVVEGHSSRPRQEQLYLNHSWQMFVCPSRPRKRCSLHSTEACDEQCKGKHRAWVQGQTQGYVVCCSTASCWSSKSEDHSAVSQSLRTFQIWLNPLRLNWKIYVSTLLNDNCKCVWAWAEITCHLTVSLRLTRQEKTPTPYEPESFSGNSKCWVSSELNCAS